MTNLEILAKHGFTFSDVLPPHDYDGHYLMRGSAKILLHDGWNAAQAISDNSETFVGGIHDDTGYCLEALDGDDLEQVIATAFAKADEYNKAVAEAKAK